MTPAVRASEPRVGMQVVTQPARALALAGLGALGLARGMVTGTVPRPEIYVLCWPLRVAYSARAATSAFMVDAAWAPRLR